MEKPIVLVIMDGVGKGDGGSGDAVKVANTPTLDNLLATCPHTYLKAHGTAVGLPTDDDMGNSEVGHNALGCGQVYSQGAKLVGESIDIFAALASAVSQRGMGIGNLLFYRQQVCQRQLAPHVGDINCNHVIGTRPF